jgi:hypothetical protein
MIAMRPKRALAALLMLTPLVWVEAKPKPKPTPLPVPAAGQDGFKAFHYVKVRNIFDPNRRRDPAEPGAVDSAELASRASDSRGTPYLALVGVLTRPEKQVGFFTGSSGEYQRILGSGQAIGAYKIRNVTMAGVELERDGKAFTLPVGGQIRFDAAGVGTLQATAPEPAPTAPALSATDAAAPPPLPPGAPASASDVLKRMMERRQQELSK